MTKSKSKSGYMAGPQRKKLFESRMQAVADWINAELAIVDVFIQPGEDADVHSVTFKSDAFGNDVVTVEQTSVTLPAILLNEKCMFNVTLHHNHNTPAVKLHLTLPAVPGHADLLARVVERIKDEVQRAYWTGRNVNEVLAELLYSTKLKFENPAAYGTVVRGFSVLDGMRDMEMFALRKNGQQGVLVTEYMAMYVKLPLTRAAVDRKSRWYHTKPSKPGGDVLFCISPEGAGYVLCLNAPLTAETTANMLGVGEYVHNKIAKLLQTTEQQPDWADVSERLYAMDADKHDE